MKPAKAPLAAPEIPPSIGASGLKGLTRNLGEPAPTKAPGFSAKTPYLGLVDSVYPVFNCDINESSMSASAVVPRKSADLTKSATDHAIRPFILLVMVGRCMPRKAARALCDLFCAVKSILTFQAITDSAYCTSVSTFFLAVAGADVVIVGPLLFMFLIDNNKCIYRFAFCQRKRYIVSYEETTERERNIWHEGMAEGTGDFLSPSCCFYGVIGCDCLQKAEWRNSLAAAGFVVFS